MFVLLLQELAEHGRRGFYEGRIAEAIVEIIQQNGGVMCLDDLKSHASLNVTPICTDYKVSKKRTKTCTVESE